MFFSPELFARRDSGIGLLWLASTLSSKASYKKISKRTALTADISQLCELITQPKEPLALRLSSNLMIGVARVYKIKQDIFMTDVNSCVSSLKKVVQDVQNAATKDAHQMVQPQARPSAFTLAADPEVMYFIEFDDLVADWDEFLNLENIEQGQEEDEDEDEDDPEFNASRPKKSKQKANAKPPPLTEEVRADMVTLKEHHDHLLSNSFDLSFQGQPRSAADASSSQPEPAFGLDLFPDMDEVIDFGLGDDLARELGEGWGVSPVKNPIQDRMDVDGPLDPIPFEDRGMGIDDDFMLGGDANFGDDMLQGFGEHAHNRLPSVEPPMQTLVQRKTTKGEENPPLNFQAPVAPSQKPPSPANSFAQQLLSQDEDLFQPVSRPLADVTMNHQNNTNKAQPKKTLKRTRLLLDVRTELTEEETKIARAQYLADQYSQRRQFRSKIREKYSEKLVGDLIWGVPAGIEAPALIDFWQDNFKVQVEARTGQIYLDKPEERGPPTKRRKVTPTREEDPREYNMEAEGIEKANGMDQSEFQWGGDEMERADEGNFFGDGWINEMEIEPRLRSSEEPGQARQISKPPSDIGVNFSFDLGSNGRLPESQRSSLFPWDNAAHVGPSSSVGVQGDDSDKISIDRAEIRMRGSSFSRRESSLVPSQNGSAVRGISPGDIAIRGSQGEIGEDFVFSGVEPENTQTNTQTMNTNTQLDSQKSELITLERNSFNFLQYAKMQEQAMPAGNESITFDDVVPKMASSRHVAAAGFYHCLVLATKDLLKVEQKQPYKTILLKVLGNTG